MKQCKLHPLVTPETFYWVAAGGIVWSALVLHHIADRIDAIAKRYDQRLDQLEEGMRDSVRRAARDISTALHDAGENGWADSASNLPLIQREDLASARVLSEIGVKTYCDICEELGDSRLLLSAPSGASGYVCDDCRGK